MTVGKQGRDFVGWVVLVAAGGVALAACTSGFSADEDCKVNRTCTPASGDGGAGGELASGNEAGTPQLDDCEGAGGCSAAETAGGAGGCGGSTCGAVAEPPTVLRVTPADGATAAEPDGAVIIELSEEIDPATVSADVVQVLDGDAPVEGELTHASNQVTFTPSRPLRLAAEYSVKVSTELADTEGEHLAAPFASAFTVRDGAWKVVDVVKDRVASLSDALPMTASGDVLVAWTGSLSGITCPVATRWFARGAALSAAKDFTDASGACDSVTAAVTPDGDGIVAWLAQLPTAGIYARRYLDGAWEASSSLVSAQTSLDRIRVALGQSQDAYLFAADEQDEGPFVYRAAGAGKWPAAPQELTVNPPSYRPSVGFDAKGNGIAIWKGRGAYEMIRVSTYQAGATTWSAALELNGSALFTADYEIGQSALAVAPTGEAMAVWRVGPGLSDSSMLASYFDGAEWRRAELISGEQHGFVHELPPLVVYDGAGFALAWELGDDQKSVHTTYFDPTNGWTEPEEQVATGLAAPGSVRLVTDGHGSRLLVWAASGANSSALFTKRFGRGVWGPSTSIAGAAIAGKIPQGLAAVMNEMGLAAVAWVNRDSNGLGSGVRLASLY